MAWQTVESTDTAGQRVTTGVDHVDAAAAGRPPRRRTLLQVLAAVLALLLADQIGRHLGLGRAVAVLCLSSLGTLVICARLGWRQALLGVASLAVLAVPAALSSNDPLAATLLMTGTAFGLGLSARWQLQQVYWLMVVSLCLLITNNPLPLPATATELSRLVIALLGCGGVTVLLQSRLVPRAADSAGAGLFPVAHSWRRSAAYGLLLATTTLITTPIAMREHWHISGVWLILTPFLVLRPFVRESWRVAVHRSLGSLAGVLMVVALAVALPRQLPLLVPAILLGVTTALVAIRRGHPALVVMALTATVVLFNSNHADLLQMADERIQANALGIAIALTMMAIAHPIERQLRLRHHSG